MANGASSWKANAAAPVRLSPRDLYRLRQAHLRLERAAIRARQAHQLLEELTLEMERRYGLLATSALLDPHTGLITPGTGDPT